MNKENYSQDYSQYTSLNYIAQIVANNFAYFFTAM